MNFFLSKSVRSPAISILKQMYLTVSCLWKPKTLRFSLKLSQLKAEIKERGLIKLETALISKAWLPYMTIDTLAIGESVVFKANHKRQQEGNEANGHPYV